jgi:hypothetical protein
MNNLTHYQNRIYDKLLPELGKTEPHEELLRLSLLYRQIKDIKKDNFLFEKYKAIINNSLYFHLKSKEEFYDLDRFKDIYKTLVEEFIEDNIDADENDFIEKYINSQQEIINKTIEYFIPVSGYESLELIQFLKEDFFDVFIRGSKNKIEFLNSLFKVKENTEEIKYNNPYPEYFNSYGYEIYKVFTSKFKQDNIVLAPLSFLIDQLRKDGLMNSDKTLITIFNFMVEEFDTNFGTATKFKSDYGTTNHLRLYTEIKKRYDIVSL